jgi:hypothetical protein
MSLSFGLPEIYCSAFRIQVLSFDRPSGRTRRLSLRSMSSETYPGTTGVRLIDEELYLCLGCLSRIFISFAYKRYKIALRSCFRSPVIYILLCLFVGDFLISSKSAVSISANTWSVVIYLLSAACEHCKTPVCSLRDSTTRKYRNLCPCTVSCWINSGSNGDVYVSSKKTKDTYDVGSSEASGT